MIVVIDEEFYHPDDKKIMLMLGPQDFENIGKMKDSNCIAHYPGGTDQSEVLAWMERKKQEYAAMIKKKEGGKE